MRGAGRTHVRIVTVTRRNAAMLAHAADDVFDNPVDAARAAACVASPDYRLVVGVAAGLVIGQARAFLQRQPDDAPWLYVDNLGVAEAWRRRGVASALLDRLTAWGARRGARLAWLGSEPDNEEASSFYAASGFEAEPMVSWSKALTPRGGQ